MSRFLLASGSPRRFEILSELGVDFRVVIPDADESCSITDPGALTEELALRKARAAAPFVAENEIILACDTVVSVDGEILGKPKDDSDAYLMLKKLSGKAHEVVSGICIKSGLCEVTAHSVTHVFFSAMTDNEILKYIATGEPHDKAGAYAIQGVASLYIERIDGDYFNVVGLPVHLLAEKLKNDFGKSLI